MAPGVAILLASPQGMGNFFEGDDGARDTIVMIAPRPHLDKGLTELRGQHQGFYLEISERWLQLKIVQKFWGMLGKQHSLKCGCSHLIAIRNPKHHPSGDSKVSKAFSRRKPGEIRMDLMTAKAFRCILDGIVEVP